MKHLLFMLRLGKFPKYSNICHVFTDSRRKPWVVGANMPIRAMGQTQLTCYFRHFGDIHTTFRWFLCDQQLDGQSPGPFKHTDGSATFSSVLLHKFTHQKDQQNLTCTVSVGETYGKTSSSVILNIHCT